MSRVREIVLSAALVACTRTPPSAGVDGGAQANARADTDARAGADADAETPARAGAAADADADADARAEADYLTAGPVRAKSIGHTSVAFKIELANGKRASFKPASRRGPLRYKGEIAAYRLGLALGIPNVPRAYFRSIDAGALAAALGTSPGAELFAKEAIVTGNVTKGALMPWIDKLDFVALEREPLWTKWRTWLKRGEDAEDRELARQASILVAFDWLTGNWDRWSGGNIGIDKASGTVLFVDNDGAFFEKPPADAQKKSWKLLEGIDRFSRSFVASVRALDPEALARCIGEESPGVPLLSTKVLAAVEDRRTKLLALVDAKTRDAGEPETLYFP